MEPKRALITGVTGQDGAYLARLLLEKGYRVVGTHRPTSSVNLWRLHELGIQHAEGLELVPQDVTDLGGCIRLLDRLRPQEVYNLAAQSFVGVSFKEPVTTAQVTALGPLNLLEAIRIVNTDIRFYQAGSSEMFGKALQTPQNEDTPFYPRSPYGVSKMFAHWSTINYREAFGLFAVSGILFNHESPLRGTEFVTRKITDGIARIKLGLLDHVELGNLDARRDWGYAPEYAEGIWRMLQATTSETFVLATGRSHSIREFIGLCCASADIDVAWRGRGSEEAAVDMKTGRTLVRVSPRFLRPSEVDVVQGDAGKARKQLGWEPRVGLAELCGIMVHADLQRHSKTGYHP